MIEFGKTLRAAREAKGLTVSDIAEKTHMMSSMIEDLENEDFSRLPAPIYGRGFVKLYCNTVGIDPAPMTAEFMEIYSGNRETAIRERVVAPEPPIAPQPVRILAEMEPPAEPAKTPPPDAQPDLFSAACEIPPVMSAEPPKAPDASLFRANIAPRPAYVSRMAPAFGRWLVVASIGAVVVWGAVAGIRALYRATSTLDSAPGEIAKADEPAPGAATESATRTSRTPLDIPPLYID